MEYIPYTYLIGWTQINKWYYGVEYGIKKQPCANPINLWTTYFTSSSLVDYYRREYGEPDIVSVRRVFKKGNPIERMESAIQWEKTVLTRIDITNVIWLNGRIGGDICPSTVKKLNMLRYGVENVFQSEEIKQKIKESNMKRFGVPHPSMSKEIMEKKANNNLAKYGVRSTLELPKVREKRNEALRRPEVKAKKEQTNLERYGNISPSGNIEIKKKILASRTVLSNRETVKIIREYARVYDVVLGEGWYQSSDDKISQILNILYETYGKYTYDEIKNTIRIKKYSITIKKLQDRVIVKQIRQYKHKFPEIKLGKCWDRKDEVFLSQILQQLQLKYGSIND